MIRLFLTWAVFTVIIVVLKYVVDRRTNKELGRWSLRVLWSGGIVAIALSLIVFAERF